MENGLDFAIGNTGHTVHVKNWSELRSWLEKERTYWAWLARGTPADVQNIATSVQNQWDEIMNNLNGYESRSDPIVTAPQFLGPLMNPGLLMTSSSSEGQLVRDIFKSAGEVAGASAYAFLKGQMALQQVQTPDSLLGVMLTAIPDVRDAATIEARLRAERQNYKSSLKSQSARLDEEFATRVSGFEKLMERGKKVGLDTLRKRKAVFDDAAVQWKTTADASVTEINTVKDTFQQFMQLKAPVEYWNTKATQHKTKANSAAWRLGWYFAAFTILMAVSFCISGNFILNHPQVVIEKGITKESPLALYFLISAGLAILSTVGFWVGRILAKLYLSEHHLMTDAEERAVMTETYLALNESGAATDTDKQIILAALFRSTADGIVRDDGPPDVGLQAFASKLLAQHR